MKYFIVFLVTLTALLSAEESEELTLSTPEAIASLTIVPDALIGGIISPLSGMPILRVTDLIAAQLLTNLIELHIKLFKA